MKLSLLEIKKKNFGAGTFFMLLGLGIIACGQLLWPPKVKVEHEIIPSVIEIQTGEASISELLKCKNLLNLSDKQIVRLKELETDENKQLEPLENEIAKFYEDFNGFVHAKREKATSLPAIKEAAGVISLLSSRKRQIMADYSEKGLSLLSRQQRNLAERLAIEASKKRLGEATLEKK